MNRDRHRACRYMTTACAAAVLGLSAGCSEMAGGPVRGPHPVIIVDIDTLRADHMGCYGYHRDTSPNMDRFATESVFFRWAFSQAPNTPPSQTSILTGLYPSTHGMVYDEDRVPEEVVTLAEALRNQGYRTAGFHDGGYMSEHFQIGQGFELYDNSRGKGLAEIGPKAISWLREHAEETFLLLVHTYDVHTPYDPPPPYNEIFMEGVPEPSPGFEPTPEQMEAIRLSKYQGERKQLPPNDLEYAKALYDGGIRYVDAWFGEFMEVVRELGLDERATIVVLSDHGEEFQEHGSVLHEKLYATVTRIPLMIRLPGGRQVREVHEVVETVDLMPTLLDLADAPIPPAVQGTSLLPLMRGHRPDTVQLAFGESPFFGGRRFVAVGHHRLLLTRSTGEVELYDYVFDLEEQNDIADLFPTRVEALTRAVDQWEAEVTSADVEHAGADGGPDAETIEQLRELGYVQ